MIRTWNTPIAALKTHKRLIQASKAPSLRFIRPLHIRAMKTIPGFENVAITLPVGLTLEELWAHPPFKAWVEGLNKSMHLQSVEAHPFHENPFHLRSITVQAVDRFNGGRIGFLKMSSNIPDSDGEITLPGSTFIRGASVAMLMMLIPDDAGPDSDERYIVFTVQPRASATSLSFIEIPAGMMEESGDFKGTAAREIKEELGMVVHEDELACLTDLMGNDAAQLEAAQMGATQQGALDEHLPEAVFPSPGACDEYIKIYSCERRIPRETLGEWNGKYTGFREEGELITLKIVPMKDALKVGRRDAKTVAALAFWNSLKGENKV